MGELMLVTGPTSEPVTLAEVKAQTRVDIDADDALLTLFVKSGVEEFRKVSHGWVLFTSTWALTLDAWPANGRITFDLAPLQSVTSIKYFDVDGTEHTMPSTDYVVETGRTPGRVSLAYGKSWPTESLRPASPITVTVVAGWADVALIPADYKMALLLYVAYRYEQRENVITSGAMPKAIPMGFESIALMDRV